MTTRQHRPIAGDDTRTNRLKAIAHPEDDDTQSSPFTTAQFSRARQ